MKEMKGSAMRMNPLSRSMMFAAAIGIGVLVGQTATAHAHLRLSAPKTRYGIPANPASGIDMKYAPCGKQNGTTRVAANVTQFRPGETIMVTWDETVSHPGHYRIAFDADGQDDFKDPTSFTDIKQPPYMLPILADGITDKSGTMGYSHPVTLPNIECNNCTLQVIQVMTDKPPFASGTNDIYYQCADLILAGPPLGAEPRNVDGSVGGADASADAGSQDGGTDQGGAGDAAGAGGSGGASGVDAATTADTGGGGGGSGGVGGGAGGGGGGAGGGGQGGPPGADAGAGAGGRGGSSGGGGGGGCAVAHRHRWATSGDLPSRLLVLGLVGAALAGLAGRPRRRRRRYSQAS